MDIIWNYGGWILTPLHVIVCLILIAVVLLQHGKGTDWAGVFGGGGTQTAFGPRGVENTLSRLTKIAAVVFMVTSLSLSLIQSRAAKGAGAFSDLPPESAKPKASPSPAASPAGGSDAGAAGSGVVTVPAAALPEAPAPSPVASPGP
jgi:preprotein translocase subunit SecG